MKYFHPKVERTVEITVHVLAWIYVFLSPLLFRHSTDQPIDWKFYLHGCIFPVTSCIAFYINYFVLIPRLFLKKNHWKFIVANIMMFGICQCMIELDVNGFLFRLAEESMGHAAPPPPPHIEIQHKMLFIVRGFLIFVFVVGISVLLRLGMMWKRSEQARAVAELGRSEAELKNLKNQINPHFLLNTLNNIYALAAFDSEKAQQAIQELSRMLRYMLYENQTKWVQLDKEVDFIQSYIALMRLRIYNKVEVCADFDFPENQAIQVAPLIFISLVENAFKHGISPTQSSFIHITLQADTKHICFSCRNSNFPKSKEDKVPGGIGLQQVRRRLELSYPGRYTWSSGVTADGKVYESVIEIVNENEVGG